MKKKQTCIELLINIACVSVLIVTVIPILLLAKYNYPSADDWSYGACTYNVIKSGGNFVDFIQASLGTTLDTWLHVEGKFIGAFFATLQPGIWGEKCYVIVPWLLLGMIIFSELYFFRFVLCKGCKKENCLLWLPVVAPSIAMQILYCPSPSESFYWYTGAMSYTFSYTISLILLVLFLKLAMEKSINRKYAIKAIPAGLLAFLIGGMNFGTSLSCFLTLCVLSAIFLIYDKGAVARTWFVTVLSGVSLMACILAPGNANRISSNFGGETGTPIEAVVMSLVRSATNIYSWTNVKVILMLFLIIPFIWRCVKNTDWKFRLPGIFTVLTFGLYASQCTATMYVDGTTGGGRMAVILFYTYYVWMISNLIYWLGWLSRSQNKVKNLIEWIQNKMGKFLLPYCAIIAILIAGAIYVTDLHEITAYRAYRDWKQGWAQQYAQEWDARLEVLHDDNVTEVEFTPVSKCPEFYVYTDLQEADGHIWVNSACATYYGKESVSIVNPSMPREE